MHACQAIANERHADGGLYTKSPQMSSLLLNKH